MIHNINLYFTPLILKKPVNSLRLQLTQNKNKQTNKDMSIPSIKTAFYFISRIKTSPLPLTTSNTPNQTMELQFHSSSSANTNHTAYKSRNRSPSKSKFVGVRQRPSGKWVAEIKNTTQKIRMWLGTFDTAEEAAQAYDEATCLLHGSNTRTNFLNTMSCNPALSMKIRDFLNQKMIQNKASSTKHCSFVHQC